MACRQLTFTEPMPELSRRNGGTTQTPSRFSLLIPPSSRSGSSREYPGAGGPWTTAGGRAGPSARAARRTDRRRAARDRRTSSPAGPRPRRSSSSSISSRPSAAASWRIAVTASRSACPTRSWPPGIDSWVMARLYPAARSGRTTCAACSSPTVLPFAVRLAGRIRGTDQLVDRVVDVTAVAAQDVRADPDRIHADRLAADPANQVGSAVLAPVRRVLPAPTADPPRLATAAGGGPAAAVHAGGASA